MKRGDIYKQMTQSMVCTHGAKYQCYHLLITHTPTKHWIWFPLIAIIYVSFFHFPFNKLAFIVATWECALDFFGFLMAKDNIWLKIYDEITLIFPG